MAEKVLIWSEEHGAWWGPDERGYTTSIMIAGRYSPDRAKAICEAANRFVAEGFHEIAVLDPMEPPA